MASRLYRLHAEQHGGILPLLLFAMFGILAAGLLLLHVGHATALLADAQTAADAAALAGARNVRDQLYQMEDWDPAQVDDGRVYAAAADYAERNDAEVVGFRRDGLDVVVTVQTVDALGAGAPDAAEGQQGRALARARLSGGTPVAMGEGLPLPPPATGDGERVWPVNGQLTSGFGPRPAPTAGASTNHPGIDLAAPTGTPVVAATAGRVIFAGSYGGYGLMIDILHSDGIVTRYAHLSQIGVTVGQQVATGQTVGLVGSTGISTGPHLHFEVRLNNNTTPSNPLLWLDGADALDPDMIGDVGVLTPYEVRLVPLDG